MVGVYDAVATAESGQPRPNASRTPTSKARGANPSSATALAFEPQ